MLFAKGNKIVPLIVFLNDELQRISSRPHRHYFSGSI